MSHEVRIDRVPENRKPIRKTQLFDPNPTFATHTHQSGCKKPWYLMNFYPGNYTDLSFEAEIGSIHSTQN